MKRITIFLMFYIAGISLGQEINFTQELYHSYHLYEESSFENKYFNFNDVEKLINKLKLNENFFVEEIGKSIEGRSIYLIRLGQGEKKVLTWSQMHGDEATGTMAVFDMLNFFACKDNFDSLRSSILNNVTLYFIPMLNPDGAEIFTRRNELQIDINRDAKRLQSPEAKILKQQQSEIQPLFGFNLHDQSTYYTAGNSFRSAAISFLLPAYNYAKDTNEVRKRGMKLISQMKKVLDSYIPGHIARYSDEFEPRAFGDNFVKWGTSSVLLESGGWFNDPDKMFLRKMNFILLISSYFSIASDLYQSENVADYFLIPENENLLFDLIIRNITISQNGTEYLLDIAINRREIIDEKTGKKYYRSSIVDKGDLSVFHGYEEINCSGMKLKEGLVYREDITSIHDLAEAEIKKLIKDEFLFVNLKSKLQEKYFGLPINIILNDKQELTDIPKLDSPANFNITKNGKLIYSIINGFLYDHLIDKNDVYNSLILY